MSKVITTEQLLYFKQKIDRLLDAKVDSVAGKGLSSHDLTDELYTKLLNADTGGSASAALVSAKEYADSLATQKLDIAKKGVANGVAELDASGKVPSAQLPSYVDDVIEAENKKAFPSAGESGKIYMDKSTGILWRWSGSTYAEISSSLALGTTSSTAYRGDYGNAAYQHSQSAHAPSNAEKNILIGIQKNGTDLEINSSTRKVNIAVPTKTSELTNDSGYKTTDTNTTYTIGVAANNAANGAAKLRLTAGGSGNGTKDILLKGSGGTTVMTDSNGSLVFTSPSIEYAANSDIDSMFL